jgi:hypothetical protein
MRIPATVLIAALATTPLAGQVVHTKAPPGGAGTVAAIAPPPPVVIVPGNFRTPHFNPGFPLGMAFFANLSVVVLPDGRIFADFGRGFERVVRNCNVQLNYSELLPVIQPTVIQPTVTQNPVVVSGPPVPYNPPVPAEQKAYEQMLNQQALAIQSTLVNETSCWAGDARGQVYIARP